MRLTLHSMQNDTYATERQEGFSALLCSGLMLETAPKTELPYLCP